MIALTWGRFIILAVGINAIGVLILAVTPPPSPHRFMPDPLKPRECRVCGRRESVHKP